MPDFPRDLPTIKFGDDFFFIDTRMHEFRQKDNPSNCIQFDDLTEINDDTLLLCYDKNEKNIYRLYDEKTPLPKHVLILRLPPYRFLDPVGLALWGKLSEDTFIRKGDQLFPQAITLSNKKVKEQYVIKKQIIRVTPQFSLYDTALKEEKFKNKRR